MTREQYAAYPTKHSQDEKDSRQGESYACSAAGRRVREVSDR